jgi:hypothetical protein
MFTPVVTLGEYRKGFGVFSIWNIYFKDGRSITVCGQNDRLFAYIRQFDMAAIVFSCNFHSKVVCKSAKKFTIFIYSKRGQKYVHTLSTREKSKLKLNSHKTWFGVIDNSKYVALVGFRTVPRKWVPEMDAILIDYAEK